MQENLKAAHLLKVAKYMALELRQEEEYRIAEKEDSKTQHSANMKQGDGDSLAEELARSTRSVKVSKVSKRLVRSVLGQQGELRVSKVSKVNLRTASLIQGQSKVSKINVGSARSAHG